MFEGKDKDKRTPFDNDVHVHLFLGLNCNVYVTKCPVVLFSHSINFL